MDRKIVFVDVDGTIVANNSNISDKVVEAINTARNNNHLVFLCTGRNKAGIQNELKQVEFDGFIASAGSYIEINNEVLYNSFYDHKLLNKATKVFKDNNIIYNYECTDCTYMSEEMIEFFIKNGNKDISNSEMERLKAMQKDKFNSRDINLYDDMPVHKISFIAKEKEDYLLAKNQLDNDFNFVVHEIFSQDNINGEVISKVDNKATGIEKVIEYLNMDIKDTIGFGDSMNDYEMIEVVNCGVVMANGSEQLKKIANRICNSVDDDGVYEEFINLGLI